MLQKKSNKYFIKLILFCCITTLSFYRISYAQKFENIGVENGLSSHQAYNIVQDKYGFIWVSTKTGIDRYNGERVVNYILPEEKETSIFKRITLLIDKEKDVWAYTKSGNIYKFIEGKNAFELKVSLSKISNRVFNVSNVLINNDVLIASNLGLHHYNLKKNELTKFSNFKNEAIHLIASYKEDQLLIALNNKLVLFNKAIGVSKTILENNNSSKYSRIISIYWDKNNDEIWVGTREGEVYVYNIMTNKVLSLKEIIPKLPAVPVNQIVSKDHVIFIGSDGGGVFKIDTKNKVLLDNFRENEDAFNALRGNGVQDLYISESNELLVATFTGGLNILKNEFAKFHVLRHEINNENSLRNNVVNNVLEDENGDFWFATNNGVSCWLKSKDEWKHYLDEKGSYTNVFLSLLQYDSNSIMAGSYSKGVYIIDKTKGVVKNILPGKNNPNNNDPADYVVEIFRDNYQKIWTGGPFKDLTVYNPQSNSYNYLPIIFVTTILSRDEDHVFVATQSGLYVVNIHTFNYYKEDFNGLIDESIFINSLNYDKKNSRLWIATSGLGILQWNTLTRRIKKLNEKQGMPSNHVYAILKQGSKNIWASTEKGLIKYDIELNSIESFTLKDGLSDESFYKNSKFCDSKGHYYFGSYNGVTYFNPKDIEPVEIKTKLYFEDFLINNKVIYITDKNTPLTTSLNKTEALVLKHNQNSFSFRFTSILPTGSGEVKYSWMLEGQDEGWPMPSLNNTANYTNLSQGTYVFKLRAIGNKNGNILDERSITINVKAAPWKTFWAKLIYIILFIAIIIAVIRYNTIYNGKKLSEAKIKFFINAAHDIRTPLTLASAPLGELKKSERLTKQDKHFLDISVNNLNKLNESVNHLLDFQKSDLGKSRLILSEVDVVKTIRDKITYFNTIAKQKNIQLEFKHKSGELIEWLDYSKLDKLLDNLISNALKYTLNEGKVSVSLNINQKYWCLIIEDTGIGIPINAQKSLFKRYYRGENAINSKITGTGIGLLLVRDYINIHKGKIEFESNEGEGTKFVLTFFRGKKHYNENVTYINVPNIDKPKILQKEVKHFESEMELEPNTKKLKMLVVEDNDDLRNYLQYSMTRYYQIKTAKNGKIAFNLVEKFMPDVIVSDVGMPEMNGVELTKKIKTKYETSHIPIILLTALTEKSDIIQGLEAGADDYITKPFDTVLLLAKIKNTLDNRQLVKKRFLQLTDNKLDENIFTNKTDQEFIQKAINFIEDNITNPNLSKQYFAQEMFVSQTLLYQKIKMLTDQSPSEFIKVIKLKRAAKMLKDEGHSVSEVAYLNGFSDSKYFSTSFKKFFGKSPSKYSNT